MKLYEVTISGPSWGPIRSFYGKTKEEALAKAKAKFPNPKKIETSTYQVEEVEGDEKCLRWMGQSWFPDGGMTNPYVKGLSYEEARQAFENDRQQYIETLLSDTEGL